MIQSFYTFDFERMVDLINGLYGTCTHPLTGTPTGVGCLAKFTIDRRIKEKTLAPYLQANMKFDLFQRPSHLRAGVRYERTKIDSSALVPVPIGTQWVAANEFNLILAADSDFTTLKGKYHEWLPAVDFDMEPIRNVKLRASYSHTITRADYASMQGGLTLDTLFRVGGGTGSQGNPALLPYKSKNIDLSAEWYYGRDSYLSVGYFHKDVSNFISTTRVDQTAFDLHTPVGGPRYHAALAALGCGCDARTRSATISRPTIPSTVGHRPGHRADPRHLRALPEDPLLNFQITTPTNSDQKATISRLGIQHPAQLLEHRLRRDPELYDRQRQREVRQHVAGERVRSSRWSASATAPTPSCSTTSTGSRRASPTTGATSSSPEAGPEPDLYRGLWPARRQRELRVPQGITVFVEGINLTGANRRGHHAPRQQRDLRVAWLRALLRRAFASPGAAIRSAAAAAASAATASAAASAATQTCPDGSVILATDACPAPPPPPPPPPPAPERGG